MSRTYLLRHTILTAFCVIILFSIALPAAWAQLTEEWVARYDNFTSAQAMVADNAGHVFVTGFVSGSRSGSDFATAAYDTDGNLLWSATYDGPGQFVDSASAIALGPEGNVYVTGRSYKSMYDLWDKDYATVAYDSDGNQLWVARYDGEHSLDEPQAITTDTDGNVYVTGRSRGLDTKYDYATVAYDSKGKQLWAARYNGPANSDDEAVSVATDSNAVYVTGSSVHSVTGHDYTTVAYDFQGNQLWVVRYDNGTALDYATAMVVDKTGHIYVTGRSVGQISYPPFYDFATVAYDSAGNQLWTARYDGPLHRSDEASSLAVGTTGNIVVTGTSQGGSSVDFATVAYDSQGNQLWSATYDGPAVAEDYAKAVVLDPAGNAYVMGDSLGVGSKNDFATVAYDINGNQVQVLRYDGPTGEYDFPFAMTIDGFGNVYVAGKSNGIETYFGFTTIKYATDKPFKPLTACIDAAALVECTGAGGAEVTLNGSCSIDPNGDVLSFVWIGPFGTKTGTTTTAKLPLGTHTITLIAYDSKGDTDTDTLEIIVQDTTPPEVSYQLSGDELIAGLYSPDVLFEMTATDTCSGIANVRYILDGSETIVSGSYASEEVRSSGNHEIVGDASDTAGNISATGNVAFSTFEANAAGMGRLIDYFVAQGTLDDKFARSLNRLAGRGVYDLFIKRVNTQSGKKIDADASSTLMRAAGYIMDDAGDTADDTGSPPDNNSQCVSEGNLLLNPSANCGFKGWTSWETASVLFFDGNPVFSVKEDQEGGSFSHISQDVTLPLDSGGQFAVLAGYVMTDGNLNLEQNLWSYFMDRDTYKIIYPVRSANTMIHSCGSGCWQPRWGIFPIPPEIGFIRFFMDVRWSSGDDPAGVTGYFDDVELRIFPTYDEAAAFLDDYISRHPEISQ